MEERNNSEIKEGRLFDPGKAEKKEGPSWYLEPGDGFVLECTTQARREPYEKRAIFPSGYKAKIIPLEDSKERITPDWGKRGRFIGKGTIKQITSKGKEVTMLEIEEGSISVGQEIRICLPQEHTKGKKFRHPSLVG